MINVDYRIFPFTTEYPESRIIKNPSFDMLPFE
jgi:hypothetical protein